MEFLSGRENLVALVLVIVVMLIFLRITQRSARASSERIRSLRQAPEHMTMPPAHNLDAPANMAQWEVQMHELARDLMGQLDTKIAILQQLLRDADERIARLESAAESELPPARVEDVEPFPPPPSPTADRQRTQEIYRLADASYTSAAIASRLGCSQGDVELVLSLRGTT